VGVVGLVPSLDDVPSLDIHDGGYSR